MNRPNDLIVGPWPIDAGERLYMQRLCVLAFNALEREPVTRGTYLAFFEIAQSLERERRQAGEPYVPTSKITVNGKKFDEY